MLPGERTSGEIVAGAIATSRGAHDRHLEVFRQIDRRDEELGRFSEETRGVLERFFPTGGG